MYELIQIINGMPVFIDAYPLQSLCSALKEVKELLGGVYQCREVWV
jgi:hypothetical protein